MVRLMTPLLPTRRRLLAGTAAFVAAPAVWRVAIAQPGQRPTPSQTEGPYYPVRLPADMSNWMSW